MTFVFLLIATLTLTVTEKTSEDSQDASLATTTSTFTRSNMLEIFSPVSQMLHLIGIGADSNRLIQPTIQQVIDVIQPTGDQFIDIFTVNPSSAFTFITEAEDTFGYTNHTSSDSSSTL